MPTPSGRNFALLTDSYKASHWPEYPKGMTYMQSYLESRGGMYPYTLFFGLQGILKADFLGSILTVDEVEAAADLWGAHFGRADVFNKKGFMRIASVHGGRVPIKIRAVPEGLVVPTNNVLATIESTDPELPWVPNWVETIFMHLWYPITVATQSRICKQAMLRFAEDTCETPDVSFSLHDFGYRGVSSYESAAIGGAAHLVNFMGTDTIAAIEFLSKYYHEPMAGFSIPATEHSTITTWGQKGELDAYRHWLDLWPTGLVACVSDSYDLERAVAQYWGQDLRDNVLARDGRLVVRPDSGHPVTVVLRVLDLLGDAFGYSVNAKGYKVLNPKVRVIQGDGVNPRSIVGILEAMKFNRWAQENVAFGMGGALLQHVDRDGLRFAFKANRAIIDDQEVNVLKRPATDLSKASKGGQLKLVRTPEGSFRTLSSMATAPAAFAAAEDVLENVYENGELLRDAPFAEIRDRAKVTDGAVMVSAEY